jgi:hypothetical protein
VSLYTKVSNPYKAPFSKLPNRSFDYITEQHEKGIAAKEIAKKASKKFKKKISHQIVSLFIHRVLDEMMTIEEFRYIWQLERDLRFGEGGLSEEEIAKLYGNQRYSYGNQRS